MNSNLLPDHRANATGVVVNLRHNEKENCERLVIVKTKGALKFVKYIRTHFIFNNIKFSFSK